MNIATEQNKNDLILDSVGILRRSNVSYIQLYFLINKDTLAKFDISLALEIASWPWNPKTHRPRFSRNLIFSTLKNQRPRGTIFILFESLLASSWNWGLTFGSTNSKLGWFLGSFEVLSAMISTVKSISKNF